MRTLYLLLFSYKMTAIAVCAIYSYKIARLRVTRTFTYGLLCAAFLMRFVALTWGIFYSQTILIAFSGVSLTEIVIGNIMDVAGSACFLTFMLRQYYDFTKFEKTHA